MDIIKMDIAEVKAWYYKKYKPILNALEEKGFTNFEIDKSCGCYLELWCKKGNIKYKFNHGISNKYPFNSLKYQESWLGGNVNKHFRSQTELAEYILSL